jgi:hypothetical protein
MKMSDRRVIVFFIMDNFNYSILVETSKIRKNFEPEKYTFTGIMVECTLLKHFFVFPFGKVFVVLILVIIKKI